MSGEAAPPLSRPRSLRELFVVFTRMALMGFGGVLPIAQRELVERQRWLTAQDFAELLSVGQVLPGPNIVNVALMVGDRFFGLRGAAAALAGMLCAPFVLVMLLAVLYKNLADFPVVAGALRGMGAVAAGLVIAMALKLLPALARNPLGRPLCAAATLITALAIGWLRFRLVAVLGVVGGLCCLLAWWRLGQDKPPGDSA
ncbi:MAG TPA: chromate transporter [Ideonella sp.]|nr:chromate transporter [Ideonella sp.]